MIRTSMSDAPDAWEWAVARFEDADRRRPPPPGTIVFAGSSSITLWDTLADDMAPLAVLNRGFGGSRMHQVAHHADRVVIPYRPRAVVLFAGTNDIAGPRPKSAQHVYDGYLTFVAKVETALPKTPIYFVSITPAPSRRKYWPAFRQANDLIRAHAQTADNLRYIDLVTALLGPDGEPRRDFFRRDRLHPSRQGYAVWAATIRPVLLADLGGEEDVTEIQCPL